MTRLGYQIPNFTYPDTGPAGLFDVIARQAKEADASGFDTVLVMDHFYQLPMLGAPEEYMLECYALLSALARETTSVRLSALVTGNTYRNPAILAKTVTTLDIVSNGRAQLGIGAAWFEEEHEGLGVPYPPIAERFERLEETIQICLQMWSDDDGPYEGKHYRLAETLNSPPAISSPRPSLLIGGSGEKKTLRMVARYADACNLFGGERDVVAHKLEVLKGHCETEGRDYAEIEKTIILGTNPLDDVDGFLAAMEEMAKLGIDKVFVCNEGANAAPWVDEVCAQTVSRLTELG